MVALFALAVQLGVSFGHFHRDGLLTATVSPAQTTISASDTSPDADARGDLCAICVTIAMANTAVDAAPPILPLPALFARTTTSLPAIIGISEPRRAHAQSRAPPAA
jgi:hypothetical protein